MASDTAFIYALLDPRMDDAVRYVGKTINLRNRLNRHRAEARQLDNYKARWLRGLLSDGLFPGVRVLEVVSSDEWQEAECRWINHYRDLGAALTNTTDGGRGGHGMTAEVKAKISAGVRATARWRGPMSTEEKAALSVRLKNSPLRRGLSNSPEANEKNRLAHLGKKPTDETRAKMSAARMGRPLSDRQREALRSANIGRLVSTETRAKHSANAKAQGPPSPETRAKMSASHKGVPMPPGTGEKISAALKGRVISAETRAKISQSVKARAATPEVRAKMSAAQKARFSTPAGRAHVEKMVNARARRAAQESSP